MFLRFLCGDEAPALPGHRGSEAVRTVIRWRESTFIGKLVKVGNIYGLDRFLVPENASSDRKRDFIKQ